MKYLWESSSPSDIRENQQSGVIIHNSGNSEGAISLIEGHSF